jgi:hypothetical protein
MKLIEGKPKAAVKQNRVRDNHNEVLWITCHSVGDQKQILGGIGQDQVQKLPCFYA